MRLKIDWASLIVGRKFAVFALFYFVFEGNFPSTIPRGGLYLEGRFNGRFLALPVWGAYIWRGLYMEGLIFGILRYTSCWEVQVTGYNHWGTFCGYLQLSQEKLKTLMLSQNFGGQRRYITGDVQVADL